MDMDELAAQGLVLLGCGRMGSALLSGWLDRGLPAASVWVVDPVPPAWLSGTPIHVNAPLPERPALVLIAVKPQAMADTLPGLTRFGGGGTLFVSVAAGTPLARFEAVLGAGTPVVRAMPNTPAAIGRGITALVGNAAAGPDDLALTETLLSAVGRTVRLDSEAQMDAVTGVSGSGPAYVFHLIETLAAAGVAEGLPPDLAMTLATATVAGAGALAETSSDGPDKLRRDVTSPNGTTAAALEVLMDETSGFPPLLRRAVAAATRRAAELAHG